MENIEINKRNNIVFKTTIFSVITLLIGGGFAWIIVEKGGPEALGAIIPLMIVGGTHLITGPVAMYQAYKIHNSFKNYYAYIYYIFFIILTISLFPPDIMTYVLIFIVLTILPIAISILRSTFKRSG